MSAIINAKNIGEVGRKTRKNYLFASETEKFCVHKYNSLTVSCDNAWSSKNGCPVGTKGCASLFVMTFYNPFLDN